MTKRELLEALAEVEDDALILFPLGDEDVLFQILKVGKQKNYIRRTGAWYEEGGTIPAVVLS